MSNVKFMRLSECFFISSKLGVNELNKYNIKKIISFDNIPDSLTDFEQKRYQIGEEEIVKYFLDFFDEVENAKKSKEGLIVYFTERTSTQCSAVVMSYFMKKANAKYELVLSKLGRICPSIKVENENIVQQLNSLVKKKTSIKNEVKENTSNNKAESEQQQKTDNNENEKKLQLSCRKCRKVLVSGDDIFIHEPGSGQASFSWRKRDQNLNKIGNMNVCGVYFIERQDWMEGLEEENIVSGKINCPSCKSKLGSYNWSGMQCSCGKWYSPAFSIQKKSVDEARI